MKREFRHPHASDYAPAVSIDEDGNFVVSFPEGDGWEGQHAHERKLSRHQARILVDMLRLATEWGY